MLTRDRRSRQQKFHMFNHLFDVRNTVGRCSLFLVNVPVINSVHTCMFPVISSKYFTCTSLTLFFILFDSGVGLDSERP